MTNKFKQKLLILFVASIIYIIGIKPARLWMNEKLFHPVIASLFPNSHVTIAPNQSAALVITGMSDYSTEHDASSVSPYWLHFPFGGLFCVPVALLWYLKKGLWIKYVTAIHLGLFGFSLALLTGLNGTLGQSISGLFQSLNVVIGFSAIILAFKYE